MKVNNYLGSFFFSFETCQPAEIYYYYIWNFKIKMFYVLKHICLCLFECIYLGTEELLGPIEVGEGMHIKV